MCQPTQRKGKEGKGRERGGELPYLARIREEKRDSKERKERKGRKGAG